MRLFICVLLGLFVILILRSESARNSGYKACVTTAGNAWAPCPKHD